MNFLVCSMGLGLLVGCLVVVGLDVGGWVLICFVFVWLLMMVCFLFSSSSWGLCGGLCFGFGVCFGFCFGCADCRKQIRVFALNMPIFNGSSLQALLQALCKLFCPFEVFLVRSTLIYSAKIFEKTVSVKALTLEFINNCVAFGL